MSTSRILVVYYSRTGTTAELAEAIARATGADVERLVDTVARSGGLGFLRSLRDAASKRRTTLEPFGSIPPTTPSSPSARRIGATRCPHRSALSLRRAADACLRRRSS
jgi:hypothetical protein